MLRTRLLYAARKKQFIDKETIGSLEKFTTDKNRALFERLKAFDGKGADEDVQNVFATFKYADSQLTLPQYRARVLQGFDFAVTDKKQPKPALNIKEMSKVAAALAVMRYATPLHHLLPPLPPIPFFDKTTCCQF